MPPLFDTHVAVDWSARSSPSLARPTANAIWIGVARQDNAPAQTVYLRTRAEAEAWLQDFFAKETATGRRVLAGFDFPFGYPAGVAAHVTGDTSPYALWSWLETHVRDSASNNNNRFAVAETLNRLYDGTGPFWGRPASWDYPDVPTKATLRHGNTHPPERRHVEKAARGAKTLWQLAYAGSVGSQVLLGVPMLNRFRRLCGADVAVWPFDRSKAPDAPLVLAEIYPSLFARPSDAPPGEIGDAFQVRLTAQGYRRFDQGGTLHEMMTGTGIGEKADICLNEEGWILGYGHPALMARGLMARGMRSLRAQ